jgi:hypothetical protein
MHIELDLFPNSTSEGDLYVESILESLCTFVYITVLRVDSPSNSSSEASFERGLLN